jgi:hypothetical protein
VIQAVTLPASAAAASHRRWLRKSPHVHWLDDFKAALPHNRHARCYLRFPRIEKGSQGMEPITVTCERCGAAAILHVVRYEYSLNGAERAFANRYILQATHNDIECPACGRRGQVETVATEALD